MELTHRIPRSIVLAIAMLAVASGGCLTTQTTRIEERHDISKYRRWSFLPRSEQPIEAPHRADVGDLDARIGQLIERALHRNGFIRVDEGGEFYVSYRVLLKRRKVIVEVPLGMTLVNSYNHTPSYWIEGVDRQVRIFDDLHLVIGLADPTGRVLWHASLLQPVADHELIPARKAVDALMRDLPVSVPSEM